MKVEIKSEGVKLKGGEIIFDNTENEYYLMGKHYEKFNDGYFNAINLKTGEVYGSYNWQDELDKNRISIVESKLLINK